MKVTNSWSTVSRVVEPYTCLQIRKRSTRSNYSYIRTFWKTYWFKILEKARFRSSLDVQCTKRRPWAFRYGRLWRIFSLSCGRLRNNMLSSTCLSCCASWLGNIRSDDKCNWTSREEFEIAHENKLVIVAQIIHRPETLRKHFHWYWELPIEG